MGLDNRGGVSKIGLGNRGLSKLGLSKKVLIKQQWSTHLLLGGENNTQMASRHPKNGRQTSTRIGRW
jgi:hypothetical protein